MTKFSYSRDEEMYHGTFDSVDAACSEAAAEFGVGVHFWVGEQVAPTPPEEWFDAGLWLEHVARQDDYSGEWAEDWGKCSKEQAAELEKEVRAIMAAWLDRHGMRPTFWNIEKPRKFYVASELSKGVFEIEAV